MRRRTQNLPIIHACEQSCSRRARVHNRARDHAQLGRSSTSTHAHINTHQYTSTHHCTSTHQYTSLHKHTSLHTHTSTQPRTSVQPPSRALECVPRQPSTRARAQGNSHIDQCALVQSVAHSFTHARACTTVRTPPYAPAHDARTHPWISMHVARTTAGLHAAPHMQADSHAPPHQSSRRPQARRMHGCRQPGPHAN